MYIYIYICSEGMITHLFFPVRYLVGGLAHFKCSSPDPPHLGQKLNVLRTFSKSRIWLIGWVGKNKIKFFSSHAWI